MSNWITTMFTNNGIPETGLTPSITAYQVSDDSINDTGTMSEIANGIYKYSLTAYDDSIDYAYYIDGGASLPAGERYQFGVNEVGQVTSQADAISASHASELAVIAGLVQRNQRIKNCSYGASGELLSAIMSIYPSASDAQNETNVLQQFSLSATYSAGNMIDYLVKEL